MSHIISYTKTGYGEFTRIVVPEGANYLMINAMGETTGNVPSTVSCLGRPILNTKNTSFPVFNYFPAYSLNEDNIVMEDLNHFYDKKGSEQYVSTKHLHDLLLSMHIAFKSYHIINDYARSVGAKIYNITQGS
jgi:hypothetical protein